MDIEKMKFAVDLFPGKLLDRYGEVSKEEFVPYVEKEPIPEKEVILSYMRKFPPCVFTSAPVTDRCTGEKVGEADNGRSDGEFMWYESWIYYFEHYNLKLNEAFIYHVLSRTQTAE